MTLGTTLKADGKVMVKTRVDEPLAPAVVTPDSMTENGLPVVPLLPTRTVPETSSVAPGAVVLTPTPPAARIRNWSAPVAVKAEPLLSLHTKSPAKGADASAPAAKLNLPAA